MNEIAPPMTFDPDATARLVAALQARTDDGQFAFDVRPTALRRIGQNDNAAESVAPAEGEQALLVSWVALYRRRRFAGAMVASASTSALAQAILAWRATSALDQFDVRYPRGSVAPWYPKG